MSSNPTDCEEGRSQFQITVLIYMLNHYYIMSNLQHAITILSTVKMTDHTKFYECQLRLFYPSPELPLMHWF